MNNKSDFVELDKALKAQRQKRMSTAATKTGTGVRGRYMDMVHPRSEVRPPSHDYSVSKKTVAPPVRKSAPKRPMGTAMDPVRRVPAPAPKPVVEAAKKPEVVKPPEPIEEKPVEKAEETRPNLFAYEEIEEEKTPNANNFSLGGRSPFLTDAKVNKRPLGPNVPESNAGAISSTKNVYSQRTPMKADEDELPGRAVITVAAAKKKSGWLWALVTLGIIAAGGGIGVLAYVIFAHQ